MEVGFDELGRRLGWAFRAGLFEHQGRQVEELGVCGGPGVEDGATQNAVAATQVEQRA